MRRMAGSQEAVRQRRYSRCTTAASLLLVLVACGTASRPHPFAATYANGQLHAKGMLVDGLREGRWREWHRNGRLYCEGDYQRGQRVGSWVEYYDTGDPKFTGTYKDGLLEGKWVAHYDSGAGARGQSRAGRLEGELVVFNRDGVVVERRHYHDNRLHGEQVRVDNGVEVRTTYKQGVLVINAAP